MNAIRSTPPAAIDEESNRSLDQQLAIVKHLIPLREARKLLPPTRADSSIPIHISTLIRWIQRGVRATDRGRVKLKAMRLGWAYMTTPEWVAEFVAAQTTMQVETPPIVALSTRSPAERRRAVEQARRELAQLGVGA
jgi:hypothetical protein